LAWTVYVTRILPNSELSREYQRFAAAVRSHAPSPERVVFFRTEGHALAFHVGRPLDILVRWEELNDRLARPGIHYVVMPEECAADRFRSLQGVIVEEVVHNRDLAGGWHERPLVLLRGRVAAVSQTAMTDP